MQYLSTVEIKKLIFNINHLIRKLKKKLKLKEIEN